MKRLNRFHNSVNILPSDSSLFFFYSLHFRDDFPPWCYVLMRLTGGKRSNLGKELGGEFLTGVSSQFIDRLFGFF